MTTQLLYEPFLPTNKKLTALAGIEITPHRGQQAAYVNVLGSVLVKQVKQTPFGHLSVSLRKGAFSPESSVTGDHIRCYQKEGSEHRAMNVHQAELVVKQGVFI